MLVGSPHSVTTAPFPPVWVIVEGSPIFNNTFTKVYYNIQIILEFGMGLHFN